MLIYIRIKLFRSKTAGTLEQRHRKRWTHHPWRYWKLNWKMPWENQPNFKTSLWAGAWTGWPPGVPSNRNYSLALWCRQRLVPFLGGIMASYSAWQTVDLVLLLSLWEGCTHLELTRRWFTQQPGHTTSSRIALRSSLAEADQHECVSSCISMNSQRTLPLNKHSISNAADKTKPGSWIAHPFLLKTPIKSWQFSYSSH